MNRSLIWAIAGLSLLALNYGVRDQIARQETLGILKTCAILLEKDVSDQGVLLPATEAVFEKYRIVWESDEKGYYLKAAYYSFTKSEETEVICYERGIRNRP